MSSPTEWCLKHPDCERPKGHEDACQDARGEPCLTGRVLHYGPGGAVYRNQPTVRVTKQPKTTIGKLWALYKDIRAARKRQVPFHF